MLSIYRFSESERHHTTLISIHLIIIYYWFTHSVAVCASNYIQLVFHPSISELPEFKYIIWTLLRTFFVFWHVWCDCDNNCSQAYIFVVNLRWTSGESWITYLGHKQWTPLIFIAMFSANLKTAVLREFGSVKKSKRRCVTIINKYVVNKDH